MKEHWKFSKEKLISAEEGLKSTETLTGGNVCSCNRLIQYAKLVLYIELILFVGWSSYTLWQTYNQQGEIRFFNVFSSDYAAFHDVESSTVPTEVPSSTLKDFKDTVDKIDITKNGPFEENNFITDHFETTMTNTKLEDSLESSNSDEDKEIILKVPRLVEVPEYETESPEDGSVIEWEFPFLWSIHKEIGPVSDDASETVGKSKFDEGFEHFYDSNENDDSNDVSEFHQTSSEKETEQQNENEKSLNSEDVPSSLEILNNLDRILKAIRAARKDLHLEILQEYDFLKNLDNSKNDETFDSWSPSSYDPFNWTELYLDNSKEPSSWEKSTESSIVFPSAWSEEESEAEKASSDSKSNRWALQFGWTPTIDEADASQAQPVNWTRWFSSEEMQSTNEPTEKNIPSETSDEVINQQDDSSFLNTRLGLFSDFHHAIATPSQKENVDLEVSSTSTDEEDNSSIMDKEWEPFPRIYHRFARPLQVEGVDSEQETIQFGPRTWEDRTEREPCTVQFFDGLRLMKCSWNPADSDRSSDSSDTTDSKSDSSTTDHLEFLGEYGLNDKFPGKENAPDNIELFDEKSNLYDSGVIDEIEKESIKTSASSEDSSMTSENPKFETSHMSTISTIKDSVALPWAFR